MIQPTDEHDFIPQPGSNMCVCGISARQHVPLPAAPPQWPDTADLPMELMQLTTVVEHDDHKAILETAANWIARQLDGTADDR